VADSDTNQQRSFRGVYRIVPEPAAFHIVYFSCYCIQHVRYQLSSVFRRCSKYLHSTYFQYINTM